MYFGQIVSHKLSRVKTRAGQDFLTENLYFTINCQFKLFFFSEETYLDKARISGQYLDVDVHAAQHAS